MKIIRRKNQSCRYIKTRNTNRNVDCSGGKTL
jgi:hypothetical protein